MEFDTDDQINQSLEKPAGECMPVQEQTLAHTIKGKDVFVQFRLAPVKLLLFGFDFLLPW